MGYKVEVGISNKHLHLSDADLGKLFGAGHKLTLKKELKQPGQFASDELVDVVGPKGTLKGIRVLGPTRKESQVELSQTDARTIGLSLPVRESGVLDGSPGVKLVGPAGEVTLGKGAIIALRHIHLSPAQASEAGVKDKDWVTVKTFGSRPLIFEDVLIRSGDAHTREFHVDTDEGNAAGIKNDDLVEIIGKK
ncbi:MAG: phosphate propanoyltransferase [Spirochaetaceae bacterium]|jgi:putative phosphotransacetylase|nr:phosphate propanoyltransferase [Spirochaetaceae bacterium]GMO27809.1 MAG: phosphate propanoyltransferase [Termitinemataceae bacterium]